jgi:predicted amidohydrolase
MVIEQFSKREDENTKICLIQRMVAMIHYSITTCKWKSINLAGRATISTGASSRSQAVLLSPDSSLSAVYNKTHIPPGESYDVKSGAFPVFDTPLGKLASFGY